MDFDLIVVGIPKEEKIKNLCVRRAFQKYYPDKAFDFFHVPADFDDHFIGHFIIKRDKNGHIEFIDHHVIPFSFWDRRKMFYPHSKFVYHKKFGWIIVDDEEDLVI